MPIFTTKDRTTLVYAFFDPDEEKWKVNSLVSEEKEALTEDEFEKKYQVELTDDDANALAAELDEKKKAEADEDPQLPGDPKKKVDPQPPVDEKKQADTDGRQTK